MDNWGDRGIVILESVLVIRFLYYVGNVEVIVGEEWDEFIVVSRFSIDNFVFDLDDFWIIKFILGIIGILKGVMYVY